MEMTTALDQARQRQNPPILKPLREDRRKSAPPSGPIAVPPAVPPAVAPDGPKAVAKDKCTLVLDREISIKLDVAVAHRQIDRSAFVNEVLRGALSHVQFAILD